MTASWSISAPVLVLTLAACVTDARSRRIPDALTAGGVAGALLVRGVFEGRVGLVDAVVGLAAGAALFLPFFLLRGLGGGDVKLLASIGAWVGPIHVISVALYAALAGAVMALVMVLATGRLRRTTANIGRLFAHWFRARRLEPVPSLTLDDAPGPRVAYAFAIAAGWVVATWIAVG